MISMILLLIKNQLGDCKCLFFLNGLDAEFEQIRGEILMRDPILDLEETYVYVCRDFVRRAAPNGEPGHSELSTMVARRVKYQQL